MIKMVFQTFKVRGTHSALKIILVIPDGNNARYSKIKTSEKCAEHLNWVWEPLL